MNKIIQGALFFLIALTLFGNVMFVMGAGASGFQMGEAGWCIFFVEAVLSLMALVAAFGSFKKQKGFRILSLAVAVISVALFSYAMAFDHSTSGSPLSAKPFLLMIALPFLISIAAAVLSIRGMRRKSV